MPSHKVTLTSKGFKILSTDLVVDLISTVIVSFFLIVGAKWDSQFVLVSLFTFIFSLTLYFFYRYKFGYIYFLGFFYQIFIFLLLTPTAFLSWPILFLDFAMIGFFFWKKNVFRKLYFPFGLFMSFLAISMGLILHNFHVLPITWLRIDPSFSFLSELKVPGFWLGQFYSEGYFYNESIFSVLEHCGYLSLIGLGTIILRQFQFLLDLILLIGMYLLFSYFYRFDFFYLQERIILATVAWYLILMGPGRNFGFSYIFSFISLVFTALLCYLLLRGEYTFPPALVIIIFFVFQSALFFLVTGKVFHRIPFVKSLLRK